MNPLIIFDLDETLIHSPDRCLAYPPDFFVFDGKQPVYKRPFLDDALDVLSCHFDFAVWTAGGSQYAEEIVSEVFRGYCLEFVWSSSRCTRKRQGSGEIVYEKHLNKVFRRGYKKEKVLIVDDRPENTRSSYGNYIRIPPFEGDVADTVLLSLKSFLFHLLKFDNFRKVEKRGWCK